ncbi:hypothetical protein [Liquorilactobacillus sicerae]|uniref:hypothetical protein n=1 Tax=Liquorilactobacillus sicerae TaxID=1416943 RepID=UPI002480796B|nr:hypothetical protein [Liquorilactobacillus sicerae]
MVKNVYQLDRARIYLGEVQKAIEFIINDDWFLANLTLKSLQVSCLSEIKNNASQTNDYLNYLRSMYQLLKKNEHQLENLVKVRSLCYKFMKNE